MKIRQHKTRQLRMVMHPNKFLSWWRKSFIEGRQLRNWAYKNKDKILTGEIGTIHGFSVVCDEARAVP